MPLQAAEPTAGTIAANLELRLGRLPGATEAGSHEGHLIQAFRVKSTRCSSGHLQEVKAIYSLAPNGGSISLPASTVVDQVS